MPDVKAVDAAAVIAKIESPTTLEIALERFDALSSKGMPIGYTGNLDRARLHERLVTEANG